MSLWNSPEELVDLAENSTSPPPLPEGGMLRQRIPGWIRWPVRIMITPFVVLDLFAQRVVRLFFRTPYKMEGQCKKRGNCCYYILFPAPQTWLRKLFYFWHTEINGFFPRDAKALEIDEEKFVVMGCRYLRQNGSCGHYHLRPTICRTWPQIEYFGRPKILKGCGFKAVPRDKNFDPYSISETAKHPKLNVLKNSSKGN